MLIYTSFETKNSYGPHAMKIFFNLLKLKKHIPFLLLFFSFQPQTSFAAKSETFDSGHTSVRLIADSTGIGKKKTLMLGMQFNLKPGWKIYWRTPGDAGYPPTISWDGSKNLKSAEILWPVPHRFSILGIETLGYEDEVVLPIVVKLKKNHVALQASAFVDYLACNEVCIPYQKQISLYLPAQPSKPSKFSHIINRYLAKTPKDGEAHGLFIEELIAFEQGKETNLKVIVTSKIPLTKPDVFFEGPEILSFSKPDYKISKPGLNATLISKVYGVEELENANILGQNIQVTLRDQERSATKTLRVKKEEKDTEQSFLIIMAVAILGGLILNLMPCVLPVLSIKFINLTSHSGSKKNQVRLSFIASAAGIIFTFIVIASSMIALKKAGMTVGWGIQFQQPWFLTAMTLIITLFACNLWGFFEFKTPGWINNFGNKTYKINDLGGHFLTGCFATLVATPCSAPFLGTAVGFALTRDAIYIIAIFSALGFGLSIPYVLVALFPGLATCLPKPGPWLMVFRKLMGFALAGTSIWLLGIIAAVTSFFVSLAMGFLMLGMIIFLYLAKRFNRSRRHTIFSVASVIILAFTLPKLPTDQNLNSRTLAQITPPTHIWEPFNRETISQYVANGNMVFIDITAEWCLTCQINKIFVIENEDVNSYFKSRDIIRMRADWTLPDNAIASYLASFDRYGIPFNAVYGPKAPDGLILPELLTQEAIAEALNNAK